jgi:PAS domain S-box-containing protein
VFESIHIDKSGRHFPVEIHANIVRHKGQKIIIAVVRDIAQGKQAKEALRLSEKKYRTLFEKANDAIFVIDRQTGRYLDANQAAQQLSGRSRKELQQLSTQDIAPEGAEEGLAMLTGIADLQDMGEVSYVRPDGTRRTALLSAIPLDERVCFGIVRDISDRKRAETALKESEDKFRSLLEESPLAISLIDNEGLYEYINPQFVDMFGYTLEDVPTGRDWFKRAFPDRSYRHKVRETWKSDQANRNFDQNSPRIFSVACKDGRQKVILFRSVAMYNQNQLVMYEDITARTQMERQLQQAQKMEAIGTLAGGIAHDFNNILFPMIGYAELLREDLAGDSTTRSRVDQILQSANRAKELVKQILSFSRPADQAIRPVRLQPIIAEVLKLLRSSIPTTIKIMQDLDHDCGVVVVDPTQIHQVVMNLATNAYHAMEQNGGTLEVSLKQVRYEPDPLKHGGMTAGEYACLTIVDTGSGIDSAIIHKIFDPYFSTKTKSKGTGLGLAVVQGVVKSSGGDIRIDSQPDRGTEAKVYLPIFSSESEHAVAADEPKIQGGSENILVVDDEEIIAEMEKQMLERLGYRVAARTSSLDALEAVKIDPNRFDLVLTDMSMPGLSGLELTAAIRAVRPDMPVIIFSGFSNQLDEKKLKELDLQGYLTKPVDIKEITTTVRRVLDHRK